MGAEELIFFTEAELLFQQQELPSRFGSSFGGQEETPEVTLRSRATHHSWAQHGTGSGIFPPLPFCIPYRAGNSPSAERSVARGTCHIPRSIPQNTAWEARN